MPNQQLLDFIKNEVAKNTPRDQIKSMLIQNGWTPSDVEGAFISLEIPRSEPQNPAQQVTTTVAEGANAPASSGSHSNPTSIDNTTTAIIKCGNCGYIGPGENNRNIWAKVLAWLCIFISPMITVLYFVATHKYKCTKCKSTFLGVKNKNGVFAGQMGGGARWVIIIIVILVGIAMISILSTIILVSLNTVRQRAKITTNNSYSSLESIPATAENPVSNDSQSVSNSSTNTGTQLPDISEYLSKLASSTEQFTSVRDSLVNAGSGISSSTNAIKQQIDKLKLINVDQKTLSKFDMLYSAFVDYENANSNAISTLNKDISLFGIYETNLSNRTMTIDDLNMKMNSAYSDMQTIKSDLETKLSNIKTISASLKSN